MITATLPCLTLALVSALAPALPAGSAPAAAAVAVGAGPAQDEPPPAADAPPLVPAVPEGWTSERFELPPSFAPDLPFTGHEELRFAPGMFTPGDATWWTYLFGLHLEGEVVVDVAFLETLLVPYYAGLLASTRGERDLDPDAVAAEVVDDRGRIVAHVDTFDSFGSGDPVRLRLEFLAHSRPGATELLVLASPAAPDGETWALLRRLGEEWRVARLPTVLLNHLYFVPDAETYAALVADEFLRDELAVCEERTTVRAKMSYTGFYLYGDNTYFEFLRPQEDTAFKPGATGLALGFEAPGGAALVAGRLRANGVIAFTGGDGRELDGEIVPWFSIVGVQRAARSSEFQLFALEYDSRFLEGWHADLPPTGGGITRAAVLERYAAALGQHERHGQSLFADVTEVRLALDEAGVADSHKVFRLLGTRPVADGDGFVVRTPGLSLVVRPTEAAGGITGFDLRLRRAVEPRTLRIGSLLIELAGSRASFELAPGDG